MFRPLLPVYQLILQCPRSLTLKSNLERNRLVYAHGASRASVWKVCKRRWSYVLLNYKIAAPKVHCVQCILQRQDFIGPMSSFVWAKVHLTTRSVESSDAFLKPTTFALGTILDSIPRRTRHVELNTKANLSVRTFVDQSLCCQIKVWLWRIHYRKARGLFYLTVTVVRLD